jgi:hypothetical protein
MNSSVIDKGIEILRKTRDGEDLAPSHLQLVELAVNGFLQETGERAFEELYQNAMKPEGYTVPWFYGIEHLTRDHQGYVRWKGQLVEHYGAPWCYSEQARHAAEAIARQCRILEARGAVPNVQNVIWSWPVEDEQEGQPVLSNMP